MSLAKPLVFQDGSNSTKRGETNPPPIFINTAEDNLNMLQTPGVSAASFIQNEDNLNPEFTPQLLDNIEDYLYILDECHHFVAEVSHFPQQEGESDLLNYIFRRSFLHPTQIHRNERSIEAGIEKMKEYQHPNGIEWEVLGEVDRNLNKLQEELGDEVYIDDYLQSTNLAEQVLDHNKVEVREILVNWPGYFDSSKNWDQTITQRRLESYYHQSVEIIPLKLLRDILKERGVLGILDSVVDFMGRLRNEYEILLGQVGLLNGGSKRDDNWRSDGGHRIDPAVFGSIGLGLAGLFSIVGGFSTSSISLIVTGCVAILAGIQGWPFEYEIDIDINRID